jgi:hypothetical protein
MKLNAVVIRENRVDFCTEDGRIAYTIRAVEATLEIRAVDPVYPNTSGAIMVAPDAGNGVTIWQRPSVQNYCTCEGFRVSKQCPLHGKSKAGPL